MKISHFFIERPVFASVISLMIIFIGLVSLLDLSVREYPKIDEPVVSVRTDYKGAAPEIIESQITKPLEDSIAGIEGIKTLSSVSRQGRSNITVRFKTYRDPDDAASDVRGRVSRVLNRLPFEAKPPRISKVESDASPIMWMTLTSDEVPLMDLSFIAQNVIKPRIQSLPGAADVRIYGDRKYAMRIWVDANKVAAHDLTVQDIEAAIREQNLEIPAGRIETRGRELSVIASTDLSNPEEFRNIIVPIDDGSNFTRLGDLATVEIGPEDERRVARYKGRPSIALGVIKQATANPLELSKAVNENIPKILSDLPSDVKLEVAADYSIFIERSIEAVFKTILEAMILVSLVIVVSLKSFRAAFIPIITIPISLIGTFSLLLFFGFSINTLTLLAMVVAVGLVVDDAIVVLENTVRYLDRGVSPIEAAKKAISEVGFAVVAMTLTLVAVFIPVIFSPGRMGRLFEEFALALAGAVLISGFVAIVLTPVMCSYLLSSRVDKINGESKEKLFRSGKQYIKKNFFLRAQIRYSVALRWLFRRPASVYLSTISILCLGALAYMDTKKELSPVEDRGLIVLVFNTPEGSSIEYTNNNSFVLEDLLADVDESDKYFVIAGSPTVNKGAAFFRPLPWENRERSVQEITAELNRKLAGLTGVRAFAILPPAFGQRARSRPIQVVLLSSGSVGEMEILGNEFVNELTESGLFTGIDSDLMLNKPEVRLSINRDLAADLGVTIEDLGRTLESMLGGRLVSRFRKENYQYEVIVQLISDSRSNPNDINSINIKTAKGELVPLASLVKLEETVGPRELNHFSQRRAVKISAGLAEDVSIDEGLSKIIKIANDTLPENAQLDFDGQSREYFEAKDTLTFVFVLAVIFIFLVLAAQFESFFQPVSILMTVPLALTGATCVIWIVGGSINVYSQIGLIALIGLITKHGILIVEFANKCLAKGMTIESATIEAAKLRFRPIIMTTASTIFGAMPLALANGPGAEAREQIGWVIVGGMGLGTLLTLFVLPSIFIWVNKCVMWFSIRKQLD